MCLETGHVLFRFVVSYRHSRTNTNEQTSYLVPFTFAGDFVRARKQSTVVSSELVPAAVIVVRHHQKIVDVPARRYTANKVSGPNI